MKTAATEIRSATESSRREVIDRVYYPETRAKKVSREEIREAMRSHFQSVHDFLDPIRDSKWLEDEWNRVRIERDFMAKIFGLGIDIDDDGKVNIVDIK